MQRPDSGSRRTLLQEEAIEAMAETMLDVVARLSPPARLRLLAFLHLLERPENATASFEVSEAGLMRLTLACPVTPGSGPVN